MSTSHLSLLHEQRFRKLRRRHIFRLSLTYLAPLAALTAYLYVQYSAILAESQRLHLRAVAESQAATLDLFLTERLGNLTNLVEDLGLPVPPGSRDLARALERLRNQSDAFVDLGFIDSDDVQTAYTGPFPSLEGRSYGAEPWYVKLRAQGPDYVVTDIHLGLRQIPHFTLAVRRQFEGEKVVFKATLAPGKLYEQISSWEGAHDVFISIVNKDGFHQLVTPRIGTPLEGSALVPPESPPFGAGRVDLGGRSMSYAYSWLRVTKWALIAQPTGATGPGLSPTLRTQILGIAGTMLLVGLLVIITRAKKVATLQMETERAKAQLAERVKELTCLYSMGRLVEKQGISLDEILQGTAGLIRDAWQHPDATCARIQFGERSYATTPWRETSWKQTADILVNREKVGTVEVCYMDEGSRSEEGPFLPEETTLLGDVADRLGRIIARKRAEEKQGLLATAIEHAAESIIITDRQGIIEYVNPAFESITGYTREEAVGKSPRLLKSGKHHAAFYEDLWRALCAGRTWEGHFVNRRKDGSLFEEDGSISPVRDEKGNIVRFVAVKHDVTQLMGLQANLRQAQKMEAIGQLAGGVAHDFNNILTVILTNTHYLARAIAEASPLRQDVEDIRQAAERAAALTRQLLAFARQQVVEPKVLDLNHVLSGTEKMLRRLIGEDIQLRRISAPDLDLVYEDPAQIEQVILNLALNARDAMPEGGTLTLETANVVLPQDGVGLQENSSPGPYVMLRVTDTGCGMDEATRSRIFEPFFTTKDQGKGTGLGLATVYGIVTQSGGGISVDSEVGKGATFKIFFPSVVLKDVTERAGSASAGSALGTETILVVEDDDSVRQTAVRVLRDHQYKVLESRNGREALDICERHDGAIHLLLTDIVMPEMGGRKLSRLVTATHPETKVLLMSGYSARETRSGDDSDSTAVFIQKPLIPQELAQKVREILDGR